jgi:hypothetical protein
MPFASKTASWVTPSTEPEMTPASAGELSRYVAPRRQDSTGSTQATSPPAAEPSTDAAPGKTILSPGAREATRREPYLCPAVVIEVSTGERFEGNARAVDLQTESVKVVLASPLPEGAAVGIELRMPNQLCLGSQGVITRCTALGRSFFRLEIAFHMPPVLRDESQEIPCRI